MTVFGQTFVIINDPEIAFELMRDRSAIHSSRPEQAFAKMYEQHPSEHHFGRNDADTLGGLAGRIPLQYCLMGIAGRYIGRQSRR